MGKSTGVPADLDVIYDGMAASILMYLRKEGYDLVMIEEPIRPVEYGDEHA
jgi:hypothetical protein